jgi:hypothetical protein
VAAVKEVGTQWCVKLLQYPASWLCECDALIYFPFSDTVRILANCPIQAQTIFSSFEAHKHDKHTQYTNGLSGIGLKFCN